MTRLAWIPIVAVPLAFAACANPAKDKPRATVEPATQESAAQAAAAPSEGALTFYIEPNESRLEWIGSKVTGKHDGGFREFKGTASTPTGKVEDLKIEMEVTTASIFSDNEKLTEHLKSKDFFDVEKRPKASFISSGVQKSAEGDTYDVTGSLELNGEWKRITFPATLAIENNVLKASAEFVILRKDFGMTYPGMPDDLIRDEVVIRLSVTAQRIRN